MRRPPACVLFVARTHALMALVIAVSILFLHWFTRRLPGIEFGPRTYVYSGGLGGLYLLAAVLLWLGAPLGPTLSRICSLIYLVRPALGSRIWETMDSAEFRAHFRRRPPPAPPPGAAG